MANCVQSVQNGGLSEDTSIVVHTVSAPLSLSTPSAHNCMLPLASCPTTTSCTKSANGPAPTLDCQTLQLEWESTDSLIEVRSPLSVPTANSCVILWNCPTATANTGPG